MQDPISKEQNKFLVFPPAENIFCRETIQNISDPCDEEMNKTQ
jgi:hypothetical protein